MYILSNDQLVNAYFKAIEVNLNDDFIGLLITEIDKRGLDLDEFK